MAGAGAGLSQPAKAATDSEAARISFFTIFPFWLVEMKNNLWPNDGEPLAISHERIAFPGAGGLGSLERGV